MESTRLCPACGQPLAPHTPQGLCPACLMKAGFPTGPVTAPASTTSARAPRFVPPTPAELAPLFPQLEILELIGQGGMGAVYKARQPALDRFVALKILPTQTAATDPGFAGRFAREARALARLNHPGIVAVFDFGQVVNFHYFIMEYVDGASLRQIERAGKLAPREALQIIPQICAALQFAHDEGIVHRDIKPENILLDKKGRVKIADFGLAKIFAGDAAHPSLTEVGHVMGTPHYMAPEQIEHPLDVDHRADIYSLGVVFYEMLTGELPLGKFSAPSEKSAVDHRLDDVVLRTLEKEPGQRYQQAGDVRTAVETIATANDNAQAAPAPGASKYLWVAGVLLALAFLFTDSATRLNSIWNTTKAAVVDETLPARDPTSPTGYPFNQHVQVMPALGTDGYHWIMQTEQMLSVPAGPDAGLRVRHVDYDGPPGGRDVHWSSSLHWLLASLAWVDHIFTGAPLAVSLERTEPWANSFVLLLLIVLLPALVSRRLGSLAAGVLALGLVVVYPFYEFSFVGYFDHHGLAAISDLLMVLFLLVGGAGCLRGESQPSVRWSTAEQTMWAWLPERATARRWFIASGIAGGAGLWISAASFTPPMLGVGAAALLGAWLLRESVNKKSIWRADPALWRVWGMTGAATSLFFYILEYFPSHFSWRLEVNHPLYAIAWLGAGDLLARVGQWLQGSATGTARKNIVLNTLFIALDLVALALVPAALLLFGENVFGLLPGTFLLNLHQDYILEFRELLYQMSLLSPLQIAGGISILPFAAVVPVIFLLALPAVARPWKTLLVVALLPALVMLTIAMLQIRWLGLTCAVSIAELAAMILVIDKVWPGLPWNKLAAVVGAGVLLMGVAIYLLGGQFGSAVDSWVIVVGIVLLAAVMMAWTRGHPAVCVYGVSLVGLALLAFLVANIPSVWTYFITPNHPPESVSFGTITLLVMEVVGVVFGVFLVGTLPALLTTAVGRVCFHWSGRDSTRAIFTGLFLVFLTLFILPFPIFTAYQWFTTGFGTSSGPTELDLTQIVIRDASERLRTRLGAEPGVVLSGPTVTTWMMYFGGFHGLGTLYWENAAGLQASAAIYAAKSDDEAYRLIQQNHVTHLAVFSWDAFADQYVRLSLGLHPPAGAEDTKAQNEQMKDTFIVRLLGTHHLPNWLRQLPYQLPEHPWLKNSYVLLFEVVPPQSAQEAQLRQAQFLFSKGTPSAEALLQDLLVKYPDYLPAHIADALHKAGTGDRAGFNVQWQFLVSRIAEASSLAVEDQVDLLSILPNAPTVKLARDAASALGQQARACLDQADEKSLRRLQPWQLTHLLEAEDTPRYSLNFPLTPAENAKLQFAFGLLPPSFKRLVLAGRVMITSTRPTTSAQTLDPGN